MRLGTRLGVIDQTCLLRRTGFRLFHTDVRVTREPRPSRLNKEKIIHRQLNRVVACHVVSNERSLLGPKARLGTQTKWLRQDGMGLGTRIGVND